MRFTIKSEHYSGNRKSWYKAVESVDQTKGNGYAFSGNFVPTNQEIEYPEGTIIIECQPTGSVKHGGKMGVIHRVTNEGLESIGEYDYEKEFLSFRDAVAEFVSSPVNPLAEYTDDDILAEAKRRGLI